MGHFHLNCSITGLTIGGGDKCVYLPIVEAERYGTATLDYMYIDRPFEISDLPYFGEYNEYGSLVLADGTEIDYDTIGAFATIHGGVWDVLMRPLSSDYIWQLGLRSSVLELLGFAEVGKTGDARYNRKFMHPSSDRAAVWSDGTFVKVAVEGQVDPLNIYNFRSLSSWWLAVTGAYLDTTAITSAKSYMPVVQQALRDFRQSLDKSIAADAALNQLSRDDPSLRLAARDATRLFSFSTEAALGFGRTAGIERMIKDLIASKDHDMLAVIKWCEDNIDAIAQLMTLQHNLHTLGLMLRPSASGPQDGDYPAQESFYKAVALIASGEMDSIREEQDDEEE